MRLETKFVQVPNDPQHINAINNLASAWGWSVQSIQVTDTKVSYEGDSSGWMTDYGYFGTKEIITEHTTYASITYQRDMDSPKYQILSSLEAEYNSCDDQEYLNTDEKARYEEAEKLMNRLHKSFFVITIVMGCVTWSRMFQSFFVLSLIGTIVLGFLTAKTKHYYNHPTWLSLDNADRARRLEKKNAILDKARSV